MNNNILRYVPIKNDEGNIIDYQEVFFCKNEQEIYLLKKECEKNKMLYEKRLKERNELELKEEENKKQILQEYQNEIKQQINLLNQKIRELKDYFESIHNEELKQIKFLKSKTDSLSKVVDSQLKKELSISYENKF